MKSEFLYPELADRTTPGAWAEAGHPTINERANKRVHEILSEYYPTYISPDADAPSARASPSSSALRTCSQATAVGKVR